MVYIAAGRQGPQGAPGPTGAAGPTGATGPQGAAGPSVIPQGMVDEVGDLPPSGNNIGDWYVVDSDNTSHIWNGTEWVDYGDSFQGPEGAQGPTGAAGATGATGATGAAGAAGATGDDGEGVPTGGTTGQVLAKNSGTDFDTEWITPSAGSVESWDDVTESEGYPAFIAVGSTAAAARAAIVAQAVIASIGDLPGTAVTTQMPSSVPLQATMNSDDTWPSRPTASTSRRTFWLGGLDGNQPAGMIDGDLWFRED